MDTDPPALPNDDDFQEINKGVKPSITRKSLADERAWKAYDLRIREGLTWKQIGERLECPATTAKSAFDRGRMMLIPKQDVETAKDIALEKIDMWEQMALDIYNRKHPMVSFGKLVPGVEDYGPKKQAIDSLIKLETLRKSIVGYTAPSKRVLEVVNEDTFDKAIAALNEQAAELERQAAAAVEEEAEAVIDSTGGIPPMGE